MQIEHPDPIFITTSGFPLLSAPLRALWLTIFVSIPRGGVWEAGGAQAPCWGHLTAANSRQVGYPRGAQWSTDMPGRQLAALWQTWIRHTQARPTLVFPHIPHPLIQGWARGSSGVWRTRRQHPQSGGQKRDLGGFGGTLDRRQKA